MRSYQIVTRTESDYNRYDELVSALKTELVDKEEDEIFRVHYLIKERR